MSTDADSRELASTFEAIDRFEWAQVAYRGTHRSADGRFRVVREYLVEHGTAFLEATTRWYVGDELRREHADWWPIDPETHSLARKDWSIEAFCREHHHRDPDAEIATLAASVGREIEGTATDSE